jgi:hypothetical protein
VNTSAIRFTVWDAVGETWIRDFESTLGRVVDLDWQISRSELPNEFVLVSAKYPGLDRRLHELEAKRHFVVVVESDATRPSEWFLGQHVDDVLIAPFRAAEIVSKIRAFQRWKTLIEMEEMSDSFSGVVEQLNQDVQVAERLQRARVPQPFEGLKGFEMHSRYYAGTRAGGDYFDVIQAPDASGLTLAMTSASTYPLSSAVLQAMMSSSFRQDSVGPDTATKLAASLWSRLRSTMTPSEQLSVFFGSVDRSSQKLNFVQAGDTRVFHGPVGESFRPIGTDTSALRARSAPGSWETGTVAVQPGDRLVVLSGGFVAGLGGVEQAAKVLSRNENKDLKTILTELTFAMRTGSKSRAQKTGTGEDEFVPEQDTTIIAVELESNVVSLKRG